MDDRIAQELRDFVGAAVDAPPRRQSLVGWDMANRAADLGEELLSCLGVGACGKVGVAGGRTCVADFINQAFQFWVRMYDLWTYSIIEVDIILFVHLEADAAKLS